MPQKTLRFKIHQDGRVEETVEGFTGASCNEATKNLEDDLGKVTFRNKTKGGKLDEYGGYYLAMDNNNKNKLESFLEYFGNPDSVSIDVKKQYSGIFNSSKLCDDLKPSKIQQEKYNSMVRDIIITTLEILRSKGSLNPISDVLKYEVDSNIIRDIQKKIDVLIPGVPYKITNTEDSKSFNVKFKQRETRISIHGNIKIIKFRVNGDEIEIKVHRKLYDPKYNA